MDIKLLPSAPSRRIIRAASPSSPPRRPSTPDSQATISDSEEALPLPPSPSRPKRAPYYSNNTPPPSTDRRNVSRPSTTTAVAIAVPRANKQLNLVPIPLPLRTPPPKGWFRAPDRSTPPPSTDRRNGSRSSITTTAIAIPRANKQLNPVPIPHPLRTPPPKGWFRAPVPAAAPQKQQSHSASAESSTSTSTSTKRGWTPINGNTALRTGLFSVPDGKESGAKRRRSASERGGRKGAGADIFQRVFVEALERAEAEFRGWTRLGEETEEERGRGKRSRSAALGSSRGRGNSSTGRKRRRGVGEMEEGEGEEGAMKIGGQGKRRKISGE